jgi:Transglycosylase-like domain/Putative peptidoglycan binding domain
VGHRAVDGALHERYSESSARSRDRREHARRARLRRFRARGGAVALASAIVCTAVAGAGIAVAGSGGASSAPGNVVVLKRGDRGPAVKRVQRRLRVRPASGYFGSVTVRAVKRFQRREGLTVDGVVGPQTRRNLGLRPFSRSSVYRRRRSGRLPRVLRRIAECESGGDPRAVSPDGRYRGKYQFTRSTWRNLGGRGDPADAPESVQDRLALKLYRERGTDPWPTCAG